MQFQPMSIIESAIMRFCLKGIILMSEQEIIFDIADIDKIPVEEQRFTC